MSDIIEAYLSVHYSNNAQFMAKQIKVEHVSFNINRQPIVVNVPTGTANQDIGSNMPQAYPIDMGMMSEIITLRGVALDNEEDISVATLGFLQQAARGGWFGTTMGTDTGRMAGKGGVVVRLNMGMGQGRELNDVSITPAKDIQFYQGSILSFRADRDGGKTWWDWSMDVQVFAWPQNYPMRAPTGSFLT